MNGERIRISWDDMRSVEVDDGVARQRAWQQASEPPPVAPLPRLKYQPSKDQSPTVSPRNPISYLGLFGIAGALLAWLGGEIAFAAYTDPMVVFQDVMLQADQIHDRRRRGEISATEAEQQFDSLARQHESNPYVRILVDPSLSDDARPARLEERTLHDVVPRFLQQLVFFVIAATALGGTLSIAEPVMAGNGRACIVNAAFGIAAGLFGGLVVSLFVNKLYQGLGGGMGVADSSQQMIARSIGFGVLGVFLSIGPGIVLRNPKRMGIGIAGGLLGGLIGGALFDPLHLLTGSASVSRCLAFLAIGGLTGAATGLLEQALKTGWLQVTQGLIAGKQFILYRNPTTIGSSPECEIYLFKDPRIASRHAAINRAGTSFEITDLNSTSGTFVNSQPVTRARLRTGDQVQIGDTCFVFQERDTRPASGARGT